MAVGESLAHAQLADASVVVPAVVEEVDAALDGLVDEADGFSLFEVGFAEMVAAESDGGDALASAAECAIDHAVGAGGTVSSIHHGSGDESCPAVATLAATEADFRKSLRSIGSPSRGASTVVGINRLQGFVKRIRVAFRESFPYSLSLDFPGAPCEAREDSLFAQHLTEWAGEARAEEDGAGLEAFVGDGFAVEDAGLAAEDDAGADGDVVANADLAGDDGVAPLPTVEEPEMPVPITRITSSPMSQLWPTWTRLSIFVCRGRCGSA